MNLYTITRVNRPILMKFCTNVQLYVNFMFVDQIHGMRRWKIGVSLFDTDYQFFNHFVELNINNLVYSSFFVHLRRDLNVFKSPYLISIEYKQTVVGCFIQDIYLIGHFLEEGRPYLNCGNYNLG